MSNFKYKSEFKYDPSDLFGHMQEEFPQESEFDVVIIGAGPNGLIAGAYLAKAGLSVAICERRFEAGGGLATEENLYPCYATNPHVLYHMMVDYMPAIRDFDLDGPALTWIKPNAQTGMVFEDGSSMLLSRMVQDTKDSISKYSFKDAVTFGKVIRRWRRIVDDIVAPATYIPPMAPIEITMAMQRTEIGQEMLEIGEMSPLEIITDTFEHEKVRTLMLYASCMWGLDPSETGLGFMVPLMIDRAANKCYCYGGSHKFASALGREVVKNGGLILEAATVDKIIMENGRAVGVQIGARGARAARQGGDVDAGSAQRRSSTWWGRSIYRPSSRNRSRGGRGTSGASTRCTSPPRSRRSTGPTIPGSTTPSATVIGIESVDQLRRRTGSNVAAGKLDLEQLRRPFDLREPVRSRR